MDLSAQLDALRKASELNPAEVTRLTELLRDLVAEDTSYLDDEGLAARTADLDNKRRVSATAWPHTPSGLQRLQGVENLTLGQLRKLLANLDRFRQMLEAKQ